MKAKQNPAKDILAVLFASLYLCSYIIVLQFPAAFRYALLMLAFSPLVLLWMVYTILKHGKYNGPELGDREFGYTDKDKD